jgi:hypothetical protein
MKRSSIILALGALLGVVAYLTVYGVRTGAHRELCEEVGAELAWIKQEFALSDADFERVKDLHEAYKPVCAEMCQSIDIKNAELAHLLEDSDNLTPEISEIVGEVTELTKECRLKMLEHFFRVSQAMPPEQGRKYLLWMHQQTLTPSHQSMTVRLPGENGSHGHQH